MTIYGTRSGKTRDDWLEDETVIRALNARTERANVRREARKKAREAVESIIQEMTEEVYEKADAEFAGEIRRAFDAGVPIGVLRDLVCGPNQWREIRELAGISRGGWDEKWGK